MNSWETLSVREFDLDATLNSGQVFHWHSEHDVYRGLVGNELLTLMQPSPETLRVAAGKAELATHYLGLDHQLDRIRRTLPKNDLHLKRALKFSPGLRILRQPKWECLATFITSSLKQVAHIRQISLLLRERFGSPVITDDRIVHAYPTPANLAAAGENALRACGLGYRAKFLHQTATLIATGTFDLEGVTKLDDAAALAKLCELPGVGPKIAQCVLLFAFERYGMFPIDVWIERALRELYFAETSDKITSTQLRDFAMEHFGPYRGYAQQWLFHHARTSGMFARKRNGD